MYVNLLEETMKTLQENDRDSDDVRYVLIDNTWYFGKDGRYQAMIWYIPWNDFCKCAAELNYYTSGVPEVHEHLAIIGNNFIMTINRTPQRWLFMSPGDDSWDRRPYSSELSIRDIFTMDRPKNEYPYLSKDGPSSSILETAYAI